jgi:hypothetical protein
MVMIERDPPVGREPSAAVSIDVAFPVGVAESAKYEVEGVEESSVSEGSVSLLPVEAEPGISVPFKAMAPVGALESTENEDVGKDISYVLEDEKESSPPVGTDPFIPPVGDPLSTDNDVVGGARNTEQAV